MSREDKRYVVVLLITIILTIWGVILIQRAFSQPQPRLDLRDDWLLYEAPNGTQWYFQESSIDLIQGVPEGNAALTERKTLVHFNHGKILRSEKPPKEFFDSLVTKDFNKE